MTLEQAIRRKRGYMRSAKICKKHGCSLRKNDVLRAIHYRKIQKELSNNQVT